MEPKDLVLAAGVVVTLFLGIWNAIVNHRISKRTTFVNTVTSQRIKWIEQLRQDIGAFCGLIYHWSHSDVEGKPEESEILKEFDRLRHVIRLRLNPHGEQDRIIEALIEEIPHYTAPERQRELVAALERMTKATQALLKEEWEKVKHEYAKAKHQYSCSVRRILIYLSICHEPNWSFNRDVAAPQRRPLTLALGLQISAASRGNSSMKTILLVASLAMSSGLAHAEGGHITLRDQRSIIDHQIDVRNKLVGELKVQANSKEAVLLAAINSHELTVLYTLQAYEDSALLTSRRHNSEIQRSNARQLAKVGASLHSICTIQKLDMSTINTELELSNPKLAKSVSDQISNIERACDLISKASGN